MVEIVERVERVEKLRPLFSCVVPVKGPRPFMEAALDSLRCQGMGDELEIIVQDGDVEPDKGQSDAINKGFAKAKGEWLFWLNADDVLLPGALKGIVRLIDCSVGSIDWIAGGTRYIDADGKALGSKFDKRFHPWLYRHMPVWTYGPSAFFRRELWERHGGLDVSMRYMMDLDLWTRWARAGHRFEVCPDFLWGFRVHPGSLTAGGAHDAERAEERGRFYARYGFGHQGFWLALQRMSRLLDGSYFRR